MVFCLRKGVIPVFRFNQPHSNGTQGIDQKGGQREVQLANTADVMVIKDDK